MSDTLPAAESVLRAMLPLLDHLVDFDVRSASLRTFRDHGEAAPLLPRAGGLDSRVEGEQVGLIRDVFSAVV